MSTGTTAPHKHSFPCNPPGGTFTHPGPCVCGKTYAQDEADRFLAETIRALAAAYGAPPRLSIHWAVAWGGRGVNDGIGFVEFYDDEEDARWHLGQYEGGRVVRQSVVALPWEIVPGIAGIGAGETAPVDLGYMTLPSGIQRELETGEPARPMSLAAPHIAAVARALQDPSLATAEALRDAVRPAVAALARLAESASTEGGDPP